MLRTESMAGGKKKMKSREDREVKIFIYIALIITLFLPSPAERLGERSEAVDEVTPTAAIIEYREQKELYDVPLSAEIQRYIFNVSDYYGVDPALVIALIEKESSYNSSAIGDGGDSIGIMQIQPKWHAERMDRLGASDLFNPYENVSVGIDILAEYLAAGQGVEWALMAYNGGASYANRMTAEGKISNYAMSVIDIKNRILSDYKEEKI